MRRYELMLVVKPDTADDRIQQILDRITRDVAGAEGQIVKVSPWGRRRLAYPIGPHREGSYFIVLFEAPGESIVELEHSLNITEDVMRHLVTRVERPTSARRSDVADEDVDAAPPADEPEVMGEVIDESESEAAPAAID